MRKSMIYFLKCLTKGFVSILVLIASLVDLHAQSIAINLTGAAPNSAAIVDISATNKGILIPRLTSTQRSAIASPTLGLMVYSTSNGSLQYWDGAAWVAINTHPITATNATGTNTGNGVAINSGGSAANHSAIFDIQGTTGGILIPRMTTIQKGNMTPVEGMLVFDITTVKFNYYNGSSWVELPSGYASNTTGAVTNQYNLAINESNTAADPSSIVDIASTTKGFLIPRLTNAQRDAILSPANGLLLYNTDTKSINVSNGSTYWLESNATTTGLPVLATVSVTSITESTASSGGTMFGNGGTGITAKGVCWSTNPAPTISDNKTTNGAGGSSFTSSITGLSAGVTYYLRAYATNSIGTSYGNEISFTTLATPVLTTTAISNIGETSATGGGVISSDGGTSVTARGVCWSTSPNPTIANNITSDGSGTGSFTSSITGLTAGTTYYVRAYATNSAGTGYGTEISFTTLGAPVLAATTAASSITSTTASSGGNVTSDGGSSVTVRGVCWSTSSNPTTSNSKTTDGSGTGSFTSSITGLTAGTTYYVRAYATNIVGTSYGSEISFTTSSVAPILATTTAASSITSTTASSGGNITSDGGASVTARGVCWATSSNPTISNSKTTDGSGTGSFTSSITGLTAGTTYYVRAYATNSAGTGYGAEISFTTLGSPVLAATTVASSITGTTASSGGNITSDGGASVTARGVCWSTSQNPTTSNSKTIDGTGTGSFTSSITGLSAGTTYYVRAYATNSVGTSYGAQISFTTLNTPTLAATTAASSITSTTASSGGNITSDGGASVTARGVCWSTSQNPTTSNSKTTDGTGTGSFTSSLTGLTAGTTYYVRAYATNSIGTSYGAEISFTTLVMPILAATTAASSITSTTASSGGNITSDGGASVTARGVCWAITSNPTISNSKTIDGTGTGSFVSSITGLTASTTYYLRAYATNSVGTSYGNEISFTTVTPVAPDALPTILSTTEASSITTTTASSGGNITSDGGATVTARGVCWATTSNPTTANSKTSNGTGTGSFTSSITGLTTGTTYYVRAYATNSVGTAYGNQISFTTLAVPTLAATSAASSITATTATSGGNVTSDGGASVTARGVCWSTTSNPTTANSKTTDGTGTGSFTSSLTGLSANTLYYVRAYATNSVGTSYGTQISFTTSAGLATLTTASVTDISYASATGGGNITSDGGATVTERGICWNTTGNPTTSSSTKVSGSGTGTYTAAMNGINGSTTYYVRAYAINSVGTAYGNQVSFTTLPPVVPTVTTTAITNITTTSASSGGNITANGGSPVTQRGVCWSTSTNPTIANSKTEDGPYMGVYTSSITGLSAGTTYYVRAYATNSAGTAYGTQVSFTANFQIGQSYGGGKIFYVDGTGQHGLIAATSDQSSGIRWYGGSYVVTGATGTATGTGNSNTNTIVNVQGSVSSAAYLCYNLTLNTYSDWYLPSKDELSLLYAQRITIGGFTTGYYWSSTEYNSFYAWFMDFSNGSITNGSGTANDKSNTSIKVRAIRSF